MAMTDRQERPAIVDALTRWALRAPLPSSRQTGADRAGRVLVALVQYANSVSGLAWPSPQTLAADLGGMSRRDVRNALDLLADAGLIVATESPRAGRPMRWAFAADIDLAGIPATSAPSRPVDNSPNLAGNLAGDLAGDLAGIPATKGREVTNPPTPQGAGGEVARQRLARLAADRRLPIDVDELVEHAHRLGHGDIDAGCREVDHRTVPSLDGTRNPTAALRARLREPAPPPAPRRPQPAHRHDYDPTSGYCGCGIRDDNTNTKEGAA